MSTPSVFQRRPRRGERRASRWQRIGIALLVNAISACTLTDDPLHPPPVEPEAVLPEAVLPEAVLPQAVLPQAVPPACGPATRADCSSPKAAPSAEEEAHDPAVLSEAAPEPEGSEPAQSSPSDAGGGALHSDAGAPGELDLSALNAVSGWAAVAGAGLGTTSGGAGGEVVSASTGEELAALAADPRPLVILLSGTIRLPRVQLASNKTLVGLGANATLEGGLRIRGSAGAFVENVIVHNLAIDAAFSDVEGDGIQLHYAHHVWIDHCEVRDATDGAIDVVHASDFVTISWTKVAYSAAELAGTGLANLIGHSDATAAAAEDSGHLRVTLHHNWWADFVRSNTPRVRFGDVHVFNNYYSSAGNTSAIVGGTQAHLLVEQNHFDGVQAPHALLPGAGAELRALGNLYTGTTGAMDAAGAAFTPPYAYTADAASGVRALVMGGAGPHPL